MHPHEALQDSAVGPVAARDQDEGDRTGRWVSDQVALRDGGDCRAVGVAEDREVGAADDPDLAGGVRRIGHGAGPLPQAVIQVRQSHRHGFVEGHRIQPGVRPELGRPELGRSVDRRRCARRSAQLRGADEVVVGPVHVTFDVGRRVRARNGQCVSGSTHVEGGSGQCDRRGDGGGEGRQHGSEAEPDRYQGPDRYQNGVPQAAGHRHQLTGTSTMGRCTPAPGPSKCHHSPA